LVIIQELERSARNTAPEEIIQAIRQAIAENHELQVSAVLLLRPGQILKTSSGKLRRGACRDTFVEGTLQELARWDQPTEPRRASRQNAIAAASEFMSLEQIEAFLTDRMAVLLKVTADEINPADTFARYGLDSIGAASLAADLTTKLGRDVSITLFYDYPSARDLARQLAEQSKKNA
jgi:acyl carrier protein